MLVLCFDTERLTRIIYAWRFIPHYNPFQIDLKPANKS